MNVLLIEPDKTLAGIITKMFARKGYTTSWSTSAEDAIEKIDELKPDTIILEIQLAKHNGVEFIHEARSYPDLCDIPIILYTSVSKQDLLIAEETLRALNIKKYLYKPFVSISDVLNAVQQVANV